MFAINNNNNPSCNLCNSKLAEIFQENELTSEWTKVHFLVGKPKLDFIIYTIITDLEKRKQEKY